MRVELIEQPFPNGQEALLDDFHSPITIAADESAHTLSDIPGLLGRFGAINIKLDKCGGLSEALAMARAARASGLRTWVGNMIGTSLAMALAFLVGQLCDAVELDGTLFLKTDRADPVQYANVFIECPDALWGGVSVGSRQSQKQ
jgi:L-alanine-DL-glutamate epimerase-like enolase superfamily enzyme